MCGKKCISYIYGKVSPADDIIGLPEVTSSERVIYNIHVSWRMWRPMQFIKATLYIIEKAVLVETVVLGAVG